MLWYIITVFLAICSFATKNIVTGATFLAGFTVIAFIVSVWTTVFFMLYQKKDYIKLNKSKNELNTTIGIFKAKSKEVQDTTQIMLSHELEIIKSIVPNPENNKDQNFTDNILSKNLLTQLPDCHAIKSIGQMVDDLDTKRIYIQRAI